MRSSIIAAILTISAWGCDGSPAEPTPPAASTPPAAPHGGDAHGGDAPAGDASAVPAGARVFFVSPAAGAEVSSPVKVQMGVEGMMVNPAGELKAGTGHHHIIVDSGGVAAGVAVPADETHIHYGKGQTETELELSPGEHTLTLQFANGVHQSYGPQLSNSIQITVK
ncbi:MAG: hypothetical protein ACI8S6_002792 [Myxococcota bacterium]|jgi:hypothetical protein